MDTETFLGTVLPVGGRRCIGVLQGKAFSNYFGTTNKWASDVAARVDARNVDTYFACSSFGAVNARTQAEVQWVRSFWVDIDTRESKPKETYADRKEALRELTRFCSELGLASPLLVSSGNGIHAYWPTDADMTRDVWKQTALLLKEACKVWGLAADPSRTSDEASVMRPVGTHNRKGRASKAVKFLHAGNVTTLVEFHSALSDYLIAQNALPAAPSHVQRYNGPSLNSDLIVVPEYPPSSAYQIADQCAIMGSMRDTRGNLDQPTWYAALGILHHTIEGDAICHEWSNGHAAYSKSETDTKIAQISAYGPTSCAKLGDCHPAVCQACPHFGKIKSPISLGCRSTTAPAPTSPLNFDDYRVPALLARDYKRQSELDGILHIGEITCIASPGGVGKSSFVSTLAQSLSTGSNLIGIDVVQRRTVLSLNGEDSTNEQALKVQAICKHFSLGSDGALISMGSEVAGTMPFTQPRAGRSGEEVNTSSFEKLDSWVEETGAQVVIIDPISHYVPQGMNDNGLVYQVAQRFKAIALKRKCAFVLVLHTRKRSGNNASADITADDVMGASAFINASRAAYSIAPVDAKTGGSLGVPFGLENSIRKVTNLKSNFSPMGSTLYFQLVGVELDNAKPPYAKGDTVAVATAFKPSGPTLSVHNAPAVEAALACLAVGNNNMPFSSVAKGKGRPYGRSIEQAIAGYYPSGTPSFRLSQEAQNIVSGAIAKGWVSKTHRRNANSRKMETALIVNWSCIPAAATAAPGPFVQ